MGSDLNLLALLSGGAALLMLYLLVRIGRGLLIGLRHETPRIEVVAPEDEPPVPSQAMDDELSGLGLERVGISLFHTSLIHGYTWYYADASREINVEMVAIPNTPLGALVAFTTWFPDKAYLWTSYPSGEHISDADLHMRFSARSLESAYRYHQRQIEVWRPIHGDPIKRTQLDDLDYYHRVYAEQHRKRHLRNMHLRIALMGVVLILMLLANVAVLIESLRMQPIMEAMIIVNSQFDEAQIEQTRGVMDAFIPYTLHWVVGIAALYRLAAWKVPSIDDIKMGEVA